MLRPSRSRYSPPWADLSVIGIAGSSGSGKTSLAHAIVTALNLPWVVIMSMDSFYKPLSAEQSSKAFNDDFDFDSPNAVDFECLVEQLRALKQGKRAEVPIYSFEKHARIEKVNTMYSPYVLILEGIFALHDDRVLEMLDLKIFADADADLCLSRRLVRDVRERGRDIEGCIKQWFAFVKPNFHRYVENQRDVADLIVPRGIENNVAISMITDRVRKLLSLKSATHQNELKRLEKRAEESPMSSKVILMDQAKPQVQGVNTILLDPETSREDFIFYFDRMASMLVERATETGEFTSKVVMTPQSRSYAGLCSNGTISAVSLLRGGSILEPALQRTLPSSVTGRLLIQTSSHTGEPELHYCALPSSISSHTRVLILDPQMSSGGAALMAVRVLVDYGVEEPRIVFVTWFAGEMGIRRLMAAFPDIQCVVGRVGKDSESRWVEEKYLGC